MAEIERTREELLDAFESWKKYPATRTDECAGALFEQIVIHEAALIDSTHSLKEDLQVKSSNCDLKKHQKLLQLNLRKKEN